jgi:alkaline phosphatase D
LKGFLFRCRKQILPITLMKLLPMTVGPIVGHTTHQSCRIFGRGEEGPNERVVQRCHGVARLRPKGEEESYSQPQVFKLNPIFDVTGVTEFYGLQPGKEYEYQMGYLFDEREPGDLDGEGGFNWNDASTGSFRTSSVDESQEISFAFGSCRYMLRLGKYLFDTRGDKIFRSVTALMERQETKIDHFLMLGDQIYADDLNFVGAISEVGQFYERYRVAFTQPHISEMLRRLPTYMVLDDHEIEDNWPTRATEKDRQGKYPAALHAYQAYQVSHSPVIGMENGRFTEPPDRYWYEFKSGCADFFVLDTRTERYLPHNESERLIISIRQMTALKFWLNDGSGKIKFVASAVPVFPDVQAERDDKWAGFLVQRTELLNFIKDNQIPKVVFLSGDVHSSLSAQLVCREEASCKITSIISSSFFWPVAIFRSKDFQMTGTLKVVGANSYELVEASRVTSEDNFTVVSASPDQLTVTVYGRKGNILVNSYTIRLV